MNNNSAEEKRNSRVYRLLVLMLAVAMLSICLTFVTIGRYSTNDSSNDYARVAAFGVRVRASDESNFKTEYESTNNSITVRSSNGERVVAPGTADADGITFSIKGTPEVATEIIIDMDIEKDVFLKYDDNGNDAYYRPVVFTLSCNGSDIVSGSLSAVEAAFNDITNDSTFIDPNTVLDRVYTLTWEWSYISAAPNADAYDTALGDLAAGIVPVGAVEGTDYCLDIAYSISITVNQLD